MARMVKVGCYYVGEHITHWQYKGDGDDSYWY